jgi:PAS domain S-box-containing protein
MSSGIGETLEEKVQTPEGIRIYLTTKTPFRDANGDVVGLVGVAQDITVRKQAEEALLKSEEKYRRFYESLVDGYVMSDMNGNFVEWNEAFRQMVGYSDIELASMNYRDMTPKRWLEFEESVVTKKILAEGHSDVYEKEYRRKDGSTIPVELHAVLVRNEIGNPISMWAIIRDITGRKLVETELRETEERFRQLAEMLPETVFEVNLEGKFTYVNEAALKTFGFDKEDVAKGLMVADMIMPEDRERAYRDVLDVLGGNYIGPREYAAKRKDGTSFPSMINASAMLRHGVPIGMRGVVVDISEGKRVEAALMEANRKLNLLSSITRHDTMNQTLIIQGYAHMLEEKNLPADQAAYVAKMKNSAQVIQRQMEFTKQYQDIGMQTPSWQSLRKTVRKADSSLTPKSMAVELLGPDYQVRADPMFEKVVFNLIDNALRHGGGATRIIIKSIEESGRLKVVFEDDGKGIDVDDRSRLFERGYGKNTGFGLFLTREILNITGITIEENSQPGQGARFEIIVPAGDWRPA